MCTCRLKYTDAIVSTHHNALRHVRSIGHLTNARKCLCHLAIMRAYRLALMCLKCIAVTAETARAADNRCGQIGTIHKWIFRRANTRWIFARFLIAKRAPLGAHVNDAAQGARVEYRQRRTYRSPITSAHSVQTTSPARASIRVSARGWYGHRIESIAFSCRNRPLARAVRRLYGRRRRVL